MNSAALQSVLPISYSARRAMLLLAHSAAAAAAAKSLNRWQVQEHLSVSRLMVWLVGCGSLLDSFPCSPCLALPSSPSAGLLLAVSVLLALAEWIRSLQARCAR